MTSAPVPVGAVPLLGCDFSSSPTARKPIAQAMGRLADGVVRLDGLEYFPSLALWQQRLGQGSWVGGFDLPFGLPRELVQAFGWPLDWLPCVRHYLAQPRAELRACFKAFCAQRPVGGKWAHRATDRPAGSSPSMQWVNPPVAWMMHAGLPGLLAADAAFPAHRHPGTVATGHTRVALEAYPGLLARELLGGRIPYKSDDAARQTPAHAQARQRMLAALVAGRSRLGLALHLSPDHAKVAVADARGDTLDAVLALVQAAWCWQAQIRTQAAAGPGEPGGLVDWGMPPGVDPLEGWIATA